LVHRLLDRSQGMFHDTLALLQFVWLGSDAARHLFEQGFIHPAGDTAAFLVASAPGFERTAAAPLARRRDLPEVRDNQEGVSPTRRCR